MGKVVFDTSMSLDGFTTGPNPRPEEPNGDGGMRLVNWALEGGPDDRRLLEEAVAGLGAAIAGRRTYDLSVPWWGPDGPTGAARVPVFVVTHEPPAESPEGGVYTFVTEGIEATLEQARDAGDGDVCVMGGASLGRQYLEAGLVDELSIHLVPVLLGDGTRMFDAQRLTLEPVSVVETPAAIHVRYRVGG